MTKGELRYERKALSPHSINHMQPGSSRPARYQTLYIGNFLHCINFGHKAIHCRYRLKKYPKDNRFIYKRNNVQINHEPSKRDLNPSLP